MSKKFEKYLIHPVERPITNADAKVDLICSKDNPVMGFFYESAFYRHPYVICNKEYALPYDELFCFINPDDNNNLGATVSFKIANEKIVTDRCCMIQVPAFVPHGPIEITDMETPIFSYCMGIGLEHCSLPEENWRPQDALPLDEMIIYYNCDDIKDPYEVKPQQWVMKCIPNKTMKGEVCTSLRRFHKSDGWVYVESAHLHCSSEILAYYGTDPWNPYELGGDYIQSINGEMLHITKPTVVFLPAYTAHCPIIVNKVEKQNFWHSTGLATEPINKKPGYDLPNLNIEAGEVEMPEPW
jgi:hypothetical protein